MTISPIRVSLSGAAAGLIASRDKAEPWKTAAAQAVAAKHVGGYIREPCAVQLSFNMVHARYADTALFNLLKATIDGLSNTIFATSPSGQPGVWSREDWRITELHADKYRTFQSPSVEIGIGPIGSTRTESVGVPIAELFVPGNVPPLSGDAAGQVRVIQWRGAIQAGVRMVQPVGPDTEISVAFDFGIEPNRARRTDIDNLCVPAAQAVCSAVFGDLRHGHKLVALRATKSVAGGFGALGTHVRIWRWSGGGASHGR